MAATKADLAENVAEELGITQKLALAVIEETLKEMAINLENGIDVNLRGFGVFSTKLAPKKTVVHPATGEAIEVPATWRLRFRPSRKLVAAVAEP